MPASNVSISISAPDELIAGTHPEALFVVYSAKLYRYISEAAARLDTDGSGGTLVETFVLIPESDPRTEEDGPYRWATYDSGQTAASWYRYLFSDLAGSSLSMLSDPWQGQNRHSTALRDLLYEVARLMGEAKKGTATAGSTTTVVAAPTFQSSVVSSGYHRGSHIIITRDAGGVGAAPEGEEAIIDSVATATATLDHALSAAVASGDLFQIHPFMPPSELIRCINAVRRRMFAPVNFDIARNLTQGAPNKYPVPQGVRTKFDIISVQSLNRYTGTEEEYLAPESYDVEFDGFDGWIWFHNFPTSDLVRVRYEKSYRDLEGELLLMSDLTTAPLDWLIKAAAWEGYRWVMGADASPDRFAGMASMTADEVRTLSGRYAPSYVRPLHTGKRNLVGPREAL